jgi:hypothetical protein
MSTMSRSPASSRWAVTILRSSTTRLMYVSEPAM